jgi:hypothetical protein
VRPCGCVSSHLGSLNHHPNEAAHLGSMDDRSAAASRTDGGDAPGLPRAAPTSVSRLPGTELACAPAQGGKLKLSSSSEGVSDGGMRVHSQAAPAALTSCPGSRSALVRSTLGSSSLGLRGAEPCMPGSGSPGWRWVRGSGSIAMQPAVGQVIDRQQLAGHTPCCWDASQAQGRLQLPPWPLLRLRRGDAASYAPAGTLMAVGLGAASGM